MIADSNYLLNKNNNFTLLRHIAALFVVISHSDELLSPSNQESIPNLSGNVISFSHIGLIIFFFLSGLLVTQSLMQSSGIIHFLWKRVLRIYPALILVIFMTVFVLGVAFTTIPLKHYFQSAQTWQYFIGGITLIRLRFFLPGVFNGEGVNGSLWSLPVEFRLYLLLAVIYCIAFFKRKLFFFFTIIALLLFCIFSMQEMLFTSRWVAPYIYWGGYFFTGVLVYLGGDKIILKYWILGCLIVIWFFAAKFDFLYRLCELLAVCYACLVIALKVPASKQFFFSRNDFSYSVYIYSFPIQKSVINMIGAQHLNSTTLTVITIVLLIPFCWFSWNYIEAPFLKLKNKFL